MQQALAHLPAAMPEHIDATTQCVIASLSLANFHSQVPEHSYSHCVKSLGLPSLSLSSLYSQVRILPPPAKLLLVIYATDAQETIRQVSMQSSYSLHLHTLNTALKNMLLSMSFRNSACDGISHAVVTTANGSQLFWDVRSLAYSCGQTDNQ